MSASRLRCLAICAGVALASCAATPPKEPDRTAFLEHMPRSILVLPPLDETPVADAPYGWLATVTRPLSERGYYVFPVALVDAMLKENGLPTAGEMHQVSLRKIDEVFGADSVLYVDIKEWGTSYRVLESDSTVSLEGRLVDVKTGTELWRGSWKAIRSSNEGNQNGLAGMLAGAIVHQIASSASDPMPELARGANWRLFNEGTTGLLVGPRHPGFAEDQKNRRSAPAQKAK